MAPPSKPAMRFEVRKSDSDVREIIRPSVRPPPAEPGVLECEPLEAAGGVADVAPNCVWATVRWLTSPRQHLLQSLVLLLLIQGVAADYPPPPAAPSIPRTPRPEMLPHEIPLSLSVDAGQMDRVLPLDELDHLRHSMLWRN